MNSKTHWLTSIVVVTFLVGGGILLTNATARQKRAASQPAAAEPVQAATLPPASPIYTNGNFTFSMPQALTHPPIPPTPGVSFKDQDIEPEIKVDLFGTVYLTAIRGYPGGVDLWKSTNQGTNFAYLGIPDGTQDACLLTNTCIGGLGGGDDSIDVSSGGYLYISSLLPSS